MNNNQKATKRALLTSVMALVMCVVMLVGTTFAWFTDTASTGVNKIVAGNLKMEVSYKNTSGSEFTALNENTNVFKQDALWEPGHVEYAVLNVKNIGTLALKYKLGINIASETGSTNVFDKPFKLSDYIKFAVIDGDQSTLNRDALVDAATNSKLIKEGYSKESHLDTTDANETVTLVVWMPTDVGNNANYKVGATVPEINLGINVVATQYTHENDSFDSTYDEHATYPVVIEALKNKYSADASHVPEGFVVTQYNNSSYDAATGKTGTITIKDAESLLYFAYVLDPATALANEPAGVWPHTSIWYDGSYARHVVLDADIDLQGITLPNGFGNMKNFDFDGQDHTIKNATINYTGSNNAGLFVGGNQGISNLVVENIEVAAPNGTENAVGIVSSDANATINNVTVRNSSVTGGKYTGAIVGYNYGSVTSCVVENCTVSGRYKVGGVVGYICNSNDTHTYVTGNTLADVTVKGENLIPGKSSFVIGKIVGNWNATVGTCKDNYLDGVTGATNNIGEIETRCTVTE